MRLDRYLAHAGYGSRNDVKSLIVKKRIKINDEIVKHPSYLLQDNDKVYVDDKLVSYREFHYILLNKPKGYISATVDEKYPTVVDLLPEFKKFNIAPVGRLDMDTTGTMLLTNNGALAHFLISPKHHVKKIYKVTLNREIDNDLTSEFAKGVILENGYKCLPAKITYDKEIAYVILEEGKYHQIKRMFRAFNYEVVDLHRDQFAFLRVDNLKIGEYRELSELEIEKLLSIKNE